jgi:hypothetical protein
MYGRDLRVVAAQHADRVALVVCGDDEYLRSALLRLKEPAAASTGLARATRGFQPGAAGFVYRVDFGSVMAGMFGAMSQVLPIPIEDLPDRPITFDFWGAVRGRTWSGGMATSMDELMAFVRSMKELESQ